MAEAKNNLIKGERGKIAENTVISSEKILQNLLKENNKKLKAVLGDNANSFMVSLVNLYNNDLNDVEPTTVLNSAFIAAALKLPIEKNLGFAYIVAYKDGKSGNKIAQFQLGYKGMMQLALRSGGVKKLNAIPIYEGQIKSFNPLTEEMEFDFNNKEVGEIIGYASYLELVNGFSKVIYSTKEEIDEHAKKFSQSYRYDKNYGKKSSVWSTQFNEMALKTMIKKILKFAPLSTDMQLMQQVDQANIKDVKINEENGSIEGLTTEYIDNDNSTTEIIEADIIEKATNEDRVELLRNSEVLKIDLKKVVAKELKIDFDDMTKTDVQTIQEWIDKEIDKKMGE